MSEKFYNPYQFIPVSTKETEKLDWKHMEQEGSTLKRADNLFVRHDCWHQKGFSGRITCELTTLSPLVVGGRQEEAKKIDRDKGIFKSEPAKAHPYRLPDNPDVRKERLKFPEHLPANSLRGMIASIAEIMSQSSLRVLTKESENPLSVRRSTDIPLKKMGVLLRENKQNYLIPLGEGWSYGRYENIEKTIIATEKERSENQELEQRYCYHFVHNNYPASELGGFLYIRGYHGDMPNKQRETLLKFTGELDRDADDRLVVKKGCVEDFEAILQDQHRNQKNHFPVLPKGYENHPKRWVTGKKGKQLPCVLDGDLVYYEEENGEVMELSYSSIWRRPVKGKLHEAFSYSCGENALPWHGSRDALTPAEWLFGVVEDNPNEDKRGGSRNLASRICFTDAVATKQKRFYPDQTLKILGSPKPPSPSLYFGSAQYKYISKDNLELSGKDQPDGAIPNGRKYYLPQPLGIGKNAAIPYKWTSSSIASDKQHLHIRCSPIDLDTTFTFDIDFENLGEKELELLIKSIIPSLEFVHRLGLGKSLGLGHVKLRITKLETIDRKARYSFTGLTKERYMNNQELLEKLQRNQNNSLINNDAQQALCALSECVLSEFKLSDPKNIKHPVCYPYSKFAKQLAHNESKGFEWFVCNDRVAASEDRGQFLRRLNTKNAEGELEIIPTLDADIHCPAKTQGSDNKEKRTHKK